MSVWPNTADATSNLTLTITPSHPIPNTGYLQITFAQGWSTSVYQSSILSTQTICLGINVTITIPRTPQPISHAPTYSPCLTM